MTPLREDFIKRFLQFQGEREKINMIGKRKNNFLIPAF